MYRGKIRTKLKSKCSKIMKLELLYRFRNNLHTRSFGLEFCVGRPTDVFLLVQDCRLNRRHE